MDRVTKRMMEFLRWMREQQHVQLFPMEWSVMRKKARTKGYIQEARLIHTERGGPFMTYELSPKGLEIINLSNDEVTK